MTSPGTPHVPYSGTRTVAATTAPGWLNQEWSAYWIQATKALMKANSNKLGGDGMEEYCKCLAKVHRAGNHLWEIS